MQKPYIDLHCHPSMKPYGNSFNKTIGINSANKKDRNSIWFYDSPNFFEKAIQLVIGVCKFTQSDMTTLAYGNVRVVCASLYPIERGFFRNNIKSEIFKDLSASFATCVGKKRVDFIQNIQDYFEDLNREYNFYLNGENKIIKTDGGDFKYILANNFQSIENELNQNDNVIVIVLTIEGLHVLHNNYDDPDENTALENVRKIKEWPHVPFFVTFAHHFNNHLCGHAKSLFNKIGKKADQSKNMNEPFFEMGKKVLKELLSITNGKRIYVDIKHMSALARMEYINMILTPPGDYYGEDIPIIVSHGAANGYRSMEQNVIDLPDTGNLFLNKDINFYDNEIIAVAKSNGIFGLQLDERRIANKDALKAVNNSMRINKVREYRSFLVWNQIQHIVELLDSVGLFAWDCIAIGTDYDGIIDPLNGFLTNETMVILEAFIEKHAKEYMDNRGRGILNLKNQISSEEIIERVFHSNAMAFMKKYYI